MVTVCNCYSQFIHNITCPALPLSPCLRPQTLWVYCPPFQYSLYPSFSQPVLPRDPKCRLYSGRNPSLLVHPHLAGFPLTRSIDRAGCRSGSLRGIYVSMNAGSVGDHRAFLGDANREDPDLISVLQDRNHVSKTKLQRNATIAAGTIQRRVGVRAQY